MKHNYLVAGVNGFLGNAFYQYLHNQHPRFNVYGLTRQKLKKASSDIIHCDLFNFKSVQRALKKIKPQVIVNFSGGRKSGIDLNWQYNFLISENILKAVQTISQYNPRVILMGSAAEYGNIFKEGKIIKESVVCQPAMDYGFVKYMQTQMGLFFARQGLDVITLRIFNISGHNVPLSSAIGKFAAEIVKLERQSRKVILKTLNLSGKRDFLDVDDVCFAVSAVSERGKSGEIYNVCSSQGVVMRNVLELLLQSSLKPDILIREKISKASASFDAVGSNCKLKKDTGWKPRVPLRRSLNQTLEVYRQQRLRKS